MWDKDLKKFNVKYWLLGLYTLWTGLSACSNQTERSNSKILNALLKKDVPSINVHQLYLNPHYYLVLDAREEVEFNVSHLPGALLLGFENPNFAQLEGVKKNQPIAIYCSVGVRSEKITRKLREMGFQGVVNVEGSLFEWINQGYSIVDSTGQKTLNVHAYNPFWGRWIKNNQYLKIY
jgi:rhodanese-related sulfurtransferase